MRITLYDHDGGMHEVPVQRARICVIEHGWTFEKPKPKTTGGAYVREPEEPQEPK